jgi:hypothetical protein
MNQILLSPVTGDGDQRGAEPAISHCEMRAAT